MMSQHVIVNCMFTIIFKNLSAAIGTLELTSFWDQKDFVWCGHLSDILNENHCEGYTLAAGLYFLRDVNRFHDISD